MELSENEFSSLISVYKNRNESSENNSPMPLYGRHFMEIKEFQKNFRENTLSVKIGGKKRKLFVVRDIEEQSLPPEGNYTEWMFLRSVDDKVPNKPAVYELKVSSAEHPAYIGTCKNLHCKLTLYNLRQNSGSENLDKFIDSNHSEIQVRYEIISSYKNTKQEARKRIEGLQARHKIVPEYNHFTTIELYTASDSDE